MVLRFDEPYRFLHRVFIAGVGGLFGFDLLLSKQIGAGTDTGLPAASVGAVVVDALSLPKLMAFVGEFILVPPLDVTVAVPPVLVLVAKVGIVHAHQLR